MRERLTAARPDALRLAGFLTLTVGAVAAGVGATRAWVVVGFPQDEEGAIDVPFHGTDVWEGKVVLLLAVASLLGLLAIRLVQTTAARRTIALLLVAMGLVAAALPLADALRARDRFGGGEGLDQIAAGLAEQLELPEDVVREQLEEQFGAALRVDVQPGLWLSAVGGSLIAVGGILSLAWARRIERESSIPTS
jgi:hypothetical protein